MIVLDYLKEMQNNEIVIPPFHTGHLGLIPNTHVKLGVISPFSYEPSHCEIILTPYEPTKQMAVISCIMEDGIGVVKKLIDAISSLKINIITQESSSINHQSHHTINLLVDITHAEIKKDETFEWSRHKYDEFSYVFPINNQKYLKIFENIITYCGDSISWSEENKLQLSIKPINKKDRHNIVSTTVKNISKSNSVKVKLPNEIINDIKGIISPSEESKENLKYILLSDTKERNLRVYFPKLESVDKIIHIGIYHNDRPGALSTIFELLANAKFNILTGLLRKKSSDTSIWEGILEYTGEKKTSEFTKNSKELYEWIVDEVLKSNDLNYNISSYNIIIGNPLYPKKEKINIELVDPNPSKNKKNIIQKLNTKKQIKKLIERTELLPDNPINKKLTSLAKTIKIRNKKDFKKRIFLSYPSTATKHAKIIKDRFDEEYYIDEYQDADGSPILNEVISKIQKCDYFLGIWHHEVNAISKTGKYGISPWMPFELGVALSLDKNFLIIRSDKLDKRIWKRITPEKAIPEYNDLYFKDRTIKTIEIFFKKHFR